MTNPPGGRSSATPKVEPCDAAASKAPPELGPPSKSDQPRRRKPAHFPAVESDLRSTIIYLTVCTKRRRPLLANDTAADLLIQAWTAANHWLVGRYVILPNHIHLFCAPNTFPPSSLNNWISFWKNHVTRRWPNRGEIPIWQTEYWDTQLRRGESYDEKWNYVENNPVRHGLVTRVEDWSYRGELNVLDWHD